MSNSDGENRVVVTIYGDEYPIAGSVDNARISRIADLVDARMQEAAAEGRSFGRDKIAILAAMSIASELDETSDELKTTQAAVGQRLDQLLNRLDHTLNDSPSGG
ncbi:cell division protein ZapA [candidate division GN15 bacterium]|nr:cell division protein ZapA [candidate division GN15 bacterium]